MADKTLTLGTVFTANISSVTAAIGTLRNEMALLNKGMTSIGSQASGASKKVSSMTSQLSKASAGTKKLGNAQAWTGKQIGKVTGAWEKLKSAMKVTASYGLASMAIYGIYQALQSGITEIINFDQGLKNLQAISGATAAQVMVMGDAIKSVAKETKFSTVEVADGMVLLTQAGFSATEAMAAIRSVSLLATGTLSSLQVTSDLLTTTIRAFSLEATEATRVADVMANAINKSKLTIDKLRISFNFVGSVAAQTGLSLEQTAASMMVLANSGLRASTIGTGLRQVLARLMAPTGKLREAFEQHNIELAKVNPRLVGFETAIKNLLPVMWDSEKGAVNMAKAFALFGLRGSQAAGILVKAFAGSEYATMLEKVYEVGASEAMAGIQAEGLGVKLKNLADRFKLVAVASGEAGVAHAIGLLIDVLRSAAGLMEAFAKNVVGSTLVAWGAWSLVIVGIIKSFRVLKSVMKSIAVWTGFRAAIGTMIFQFKMLNATLLVSNNYVRGLKAAWMAFTSMIANMSVMGKLVLIFGLAATAIGLLSGRTKKYIEKLAKTVETNRAAIDSIRQYSDSLENLNEKLQRGEDVTAQYTTTIERLKKDHKDLALYVDFNTASHEQLNQAMMDMQWDKFNAGLDDLTKLVIAQSERVEHLRTVFANLDTDIALTSLGIVGPDIKDDENVVKKTFETWAMGRQALVDLANTQQSYIAAMVYFTKIEKQSADEAREKIKIYFAKHNAIEKVTDALNQFNKALEKSSKIDPTINLKDITKEYESYYNTLDLLGQAHLVQETASSMLAQKHLEANLQKKIGTHKDAWKIIGALIGESQAKILMKQIDTNKKEKMSASELVEFKKSELKKYIDAVEAAYEKSVVSEKDSYKDSIAVIKETSDTKLANEKLTTIQRNNIIAQSLAKEKKLTEKHNKTLEDMAQKHEGVMIGIKSAGAQLAIDDKSADIATLKAKKKQADMEIAIELSKSKAILEIKKRASIDDIATMEAINKEERDLELQAMKKSLKNYQEYYEDLKKTDSVSKTELLAAALKLNKMIEAVEDKKTSNMKDDTKDRNVAEKKAFDESLANTQLYSDEWVTIIREMYLKGMIGPAEYRDQMTQYLDDLAEQWKKGIVPVEEYLAAVKKALLETAISEEDANERRIRANGTFWEALKWGFENSKTDLLSWQDIVIEVGQGFVKQFANNAAGALMDFVDGTKSAKEAFQDFARSTLRWIAELIIKLTIMKALQSMGLGSSLDASAGLGAAWDTVSSWGSGGIIGVTPQPVRIVNPNIFANAKHYQSGGIIGNEVPIIAHKNEGIFTPEQMAAMGGGQTTVELTNVNIVDDRALSQLLSTSKGKSAMLNFIGENATMVKKVLGSR